MPRELTELEKKVLGYIKDHPGLTPEDIANRFGDDSSYVDIINSYTDVFEAVHYLVNMDYARQEANYAVYAKV